MADLIRRNPGGALRRAEPFYRPLELLSNFDELARNIFGNVAEFNEGLVHHLDIYREKDDLVVKAELPGVDKDGLDISLEDDVLTIKAEKKKEEVDEDATYYRSERYFGKYVRTIPLPFAVNPGKVSATLENGLLELRLPKAEEIKARKIDIGVK